MNTKIGQTTLGELMPLFIIIAILLLIIIFCIRMTIITSKAKKERKKETKALKANGMTCEAALSHVNGLPIPENTLCNIRSFSDRIEISTNGNQFNLSKDKITDICFKTDVEIQKQYVSSVGGAIGGAVLFGPLGAMIGGRAKQKKNKEIHTYLIFTYQKGDTIEYIGFDATNSLFNAGKFVDEFKKSGNRVKTVIDL